MPPPLSNKKSAPQKIRKKKIFGCRPLNLRGTSIPSLSLFSTIQNAKSLREYLRLNIRATQFCVSIPNRSFASGSLSARSRIAFFSKISVAAPIGFLLLFANWNFSLSPPAFFLSSLSLSKKRRAFPTLSFTHSSCPSQIALGAEMNRVVCVCVLRPRFTSTQCACMRKNSLKARENIFSPRFSRFLIHAYLDTFFAFSASSNKNSLIALCRNQKRDLPIVASFQKNKN